ncbi:hypothetical protein OTK49_00955 [Vibrio coralliirubri]|uniref:hypothetical protein n=1 Tax=Vibrio coralliirubri TaxID=1516159 RepID=UPI002284E121|nr:hypothetical protein [Vibrio coralliirubri]MCY9861100.1 hypothetical protein [Vibrio coralliirubri]
MAEKIKATETPELDLNTATRIDVTYNRFSVEGGIDSAVFENLEQVYCIFPEESARLAESMKGHANFTDLEEAPAPEQVLVCGLFRDFCTNERTSDLFNSIIPILVSAHANANKEHFKQEVANGHIHIDLAQLLELFGFDADQVALSMGIEIIEANKPMRFTSIDDLPEFIPEEVKLQLTKLREDAIANGETSGTRLLEITSDGAKLVSKEEYDSRFGDGSFDSSVGNFKMDVEALERGAHEAPKTLQ